MRLMEARVRNYKCVLDSNWFTIDDLTCLVGKNESGKTAVLEALEKVSSVDKDRQDFSETDYPRINQSEYEDSNEVAVAVDTRWELDDDEVEYINGLVGIDVLRSHTVVLSKDYDNERVWSIDLDNQAAVSALLKESGLNATDRNPLNGIVTPADLIKTLKNLTTPTPRQTTFLKELNEQLPQGSLRATVTAYLGSRVPSFVYYSQYDRLPGRVSVNQLLSAKSSGTLKQLEGAKVFISLLSMVGITPEQLNSIATSEGLISKLEGVQARISRQIFKYWSQNKHLKVRFRFDAAKPGDPPPYNEGMVFQTRIENTRHEATINLSERSTGFIWFFSFLVWFSEVRREHGNNLIVLLDEPGLSLHGRAQYDLLRYIKEELLAKYQVIYTTHSPFMIDASDLLSCRTVEDVVTDGDEVIGTKVGQDILATDRDTLFPLQAALGYELTQSLFVGEHCLLVEGPSDLLYLQWASDQLRARGRTGLDLRWTITPCEGLAKVSSFMVLFGGNNLHIAVLTDFSHGDKAKVRALRESELLREGHVFTADMFVAGASEADIEDMLGRSFYVSLVNAAYELKDATLLPNAKPKSAPQRVTLEVEGHFRTLPASVAEYDHYHPATYLIRNGERLTLDGLDEALDRFEAFFKQLNAKL